ncbi:hypothetical protein NC651_034335 [Populus alba x Populus x berolinensis]|nr:hypothetical protein NC651_034335 [Populus alba x Populus x berolinensis]
MHLQICLTPTIIVWGEGEDIQRKDHKKGGTSALDGERREKKKRKNQRRERTRGFFSEAEKNHKNRENTNRGEKKPKNWVCKQRTDENKRKGINREKDQNRRTQLEGRVTSARKNKPPSSAAP